jgi:hypothetical protein
MERKGPVLSLIICFSAPIAWRGLTERYLRSVEISLLNKARDIRNSGVSSQANSTSTFRYASSATH